MTLDRRGQLVLVTGASAGIGAEFARQLAQRGADLVLVARRVDRLTALAVELRAAHGVTVTVLPADLTETGVAERLAGELRERGLRLTGLVNNAGFGTFGPFHKEDPERIGAEITVNVRALVDLTRTFLDDLLAAPQGLLINVSSVGGYAPVPKMAVYGATKAFVLSFTEALWEEYRGSRLRILALSPNATSSEFFDVAGAEAAASSTRMHSAELVVRTALRTVARRDPPPSVAVGWTTRLLLALGRLSSRRRAVRIAGGMTTASEARARRSRA
ncbi:SDR family NAD(P)-dependent oxidoreductase [Actinoalloteichus spitiensis]|uniref:SDR family NAD(P)-dependent oxidoreductase n=1 Tax=Actinoalloteichus spitiensis TaxID=252394 RepID=UPI00037D1EB4|nr:SDR family oxidoreductase [Actinoalloteichus spitiensis]